jgi:hypothetical protein
MQRRPSFIAIYLASFGGHGNGRNRARPCSPRRQHMRQIRGLSFASQLGSSYDADPRMSPRSANGTYDEHQYDFV